MQDILVFVSEQWMLFSLLVLILILMVITARPSRSEISCHDAVKLINDKEVVVYDIRTEDQYRQAHIVNSINTKLPEIDFEKNKEGSILIYGAESLQLIKQVEKILKTKDESLKSRVYVLKHGLGDWLREDLPVVTGKTEVQAEKTSNKRVNNKKVNRKPRK